MSRILRRPMFRGGKVIDSRGTGITSGLMDGGRVGYRNGKFVTGAELMSAAGAFPELNMFKNIKLNPKSKFPIGQGNVINIGGQDLDVDRIASFMATPGMQDLAFADNYNLSASLGGDENKDENIRIASKDVENLKIGKKDDEIDYDQSFDIDSIKSEDAYKPPKKGSTADIKQKELSGEIDSTPSKESLAIAGITDEPDEQPKVEDPDQDIKEMADRYFELMGGGKAFSRDVGDMLLRFAGAEGETVGDKFKAYLRDEAKAGPSRTEKIKDAAAKTAINYQTQKEFLEKKIASSESIAEKNIAAQKLRDLNKKFAPGITQKKIDYLKTLKPGSRDYQLALADFGLATSFDAQVYKDMNNNQPLTVETADTYASIYYPNYQGRLTADSKKGGMYLDVEKKELVLVDGETGEITTFKALQLQ